MVTDKQESDLKASIEKFDLVEIPVIDTDNTICAGHQRVHILWMLGRQDDTIDVRVPNRKMTEEEFNEYNVRSVHGKQHDDPDHGHDNVAVDLQVRLCHRWNARGGRKVGTRGDERIVLRCTAVARVVGRVVGLCDDVCIQDEEQVEEEREKKNRSRL